MRSIELEFNSGPASLAGTLLLVDHMDPQPAVLLISGSGPIDRNSDMKRMPIGVMGQLADHLARQGLTSLRYDKRGVGVSKGDYQRTGLRDNVDDARTAVAALRSRPEVDPQRIFVVGHSEGALIASELAATDSDLAGVVLLAGPATDGEEVLMWQMDQVKDSLPRPVKLLMKVLRQDLVTTQTKRLERLKATTTDTVRMQLVKINAKWFREFLAHDPAPSLAKIDLPVLAITGSKDIQVDPAHVERICEFVPGPCTGHVVENLSHILRIEPGPPSVRTYKKQVKLPIDETIPKLVGAWIAERVKGGALESGTDCHVR